MARVDQLLASLGYGSRREVRAWIAAGRVTVAGIPETDPAKRVQPTEVRIDGQPPDHPGELLLMMNKPAGRVCTHDSGEGPTIYELLPPRWQRRNPVVTSIGRLDKETTGLLLLTDQSAAVHRLTSPQHKVPKTYRALLDRDIPTGLEDLFARGTLLLPGEKEPCAAATLNRIGDRQAEVILTEGRYHQVRRMFASQGCTVVQLDRIRFASLELAKLERGQWMELPISTLEQF